MSNVKLVKEVYAATPVDFLVLQDPGIAHLVVHQNEIVSSRRVPGMSVEAMELEDGVRADISIEDGCVIPQPVHLCFGVLPEEGVQRIFMNVRVGRKAKIQVLAHCVFPNAVDVRHHMDAQIRLEESADFSYFERHVHGPAGGVRVYPRAEARLGKGARFKNEFEFLHGRAGLIDIQYRADCDDESVVEMKARINGRGSDNITIREEGNLNGTGSAGALITRVAVSDKAHAEVHNKIVALSPYARGHVDCKEVIRDQATAVAIPVVEVKHPKARVTHEAAIGSVDMKQLETLMSRGLTEDEASELIIQGLLS